MSFTTRGSLDRKGIPAGYRETLYWRLGEKRWRVITVNLVALLSLAFWLLLFRWLGINVGRIPHSAFILPPWVLVLAGILLTLVVHELTHALAMVAFGAHVQFGGLLTQGMLYATAPGHAFTRSAFLVIGLAPLVGISLLASIGIILLAGTPWVNLLALCAAGNVAMASGDLWIVSIVLRYPHSARVIDERDGVRILLPG